MTWYQQSKRFGDTHLGTVTRGRVNADCGIQFPAAAALTADPAPDQLCPECCGDYAEWLMLLRVAGGIIGQHDDLWYCHDEHRRPIFPIDATLVARLYKDDLFWFTEPDESGKIEISLTLYGKTRLSELDERMSQMFRHAK
jgi:hypothetical protein